jgi:hypothetical protein
VLDGPVPFFQQEAIQIFVLKRDLFELSHTADRAEWYMLVKQLVFNAADEFWMSLAMLARQGWFPKASPYEAERPIVCARAILMYVRFWEVFAELHDRFFDGEIARDWTRWGFAALATARKMGHSSEELKWLRTRPAGEAVTILRQWAEGESEGNTTFPAEG